MYHIQYILHYLSQISDANLISVAVSTASSFYSLLPFETVYIDVWVHALAHNVFVWCINIGWVHIDVYDNYWMMCPFCLSSRCLKGQMSHGLRNSIIPTWRPVPSSKSHECRTVPSSSNILRTKWAWLTCLHTACLHLRKVWTEIKKINCVGHWFCKMFRCVFGFLFSPVTFCVM